ncbi:MAG: TVP38/TMEM64 family protein [Desulfocapsaceae bacterium]|nr:TVP38/TMEM64 family protein [Desulfocapsaceae bacterium]
MNKSTIKKLAIVILALVAVVIFVAFDLDRYLSLSYIKESQAHLQSLYAENPFLTLSAYVAIYIIVTALSLPGAVVLTLAGGALFGLVAGTIAVSIASTTGATLACFVSRFILQNWVQEKFSDKLEPINRGVEKEGAFYLFSVRLIPVFPFFVINLVMGLTRMPLRTFFWVSQLGMLPGTLVFVNAGKELGQIESASGILSPSLIISFIILGLFPITAKKIMQRVRKKVVDKKSVEVK